MTKSIMRSNIIITLFKNTITLNSITSKICPLPKFLVKFLMEDLDFGIVLEDFVLNPHIFSLYTFHDHKWPCFSRSY